MALKEKLIDKAQKLVAKGQLDKAIVEYRAAIDVDPRDISIRLRIGDLYVKLGKKPEAIKEYTEAARANAQRGFYLKAIAVYKQILKLEENLEIHNKLAELYVKQRLIADAVGEYSYIVTWFERRGKTSEVLEILKKMVEIDPENVGVRLKLAELYQKLSFDKDALSEYCLIFDKLVSAGKLDTAEKVFLQLYNTNSTEERVLAGLAELYRLKGDNVQRLRFLKGLFNYYSDSAMTDEARRVASDIVQIKPDDPHALRLLKKSETRHVPEEPPAMLRVEAAEPTKAEAVEPALISWPEEEIEIEIEGFEESKEAAAPEPSVKIEEAPAQEAERVDDGQGRIVEAAPAVSAPAQPGEIEIDIEGLLSGELQIAASPSVESAREPMEAAVDDAVEEANIEPHEEPAVEEPAAPAVEAVAEEAGIEEAISVISTELQEEERVVPLAEEPVEQAEAYGEAQVKEAPIDDIIEVHERADVVSESVEAAQEAIEAIEQVQASSADIEQVLDMETGPEPSEADEIQENTDEPADADIVESVSVQAEPIEEAISVEAQEEGSGAQEAQDEPVIAEAEAEPLAVEIEATEIEAQAVEAESAAEEIEEELKEEDLSSAIQELMDKMEPEEAPQAAGAEAARAGEEYVDLSAELGMEEASEDLAGSWGGKESAETFDEFKTGIGKQLSREDSETHYNLGIAYMEMELFSEASKEFKIAMKEARLELDCYLRLGLCAMAESNAEEAIVFYSKGLMAASTDEEKKGMTYELALAYEAAGQDENAFDLFSSIFASDPDFREVASKVSGLAFSRPLVPLNDGLIEVELL